MACGSRDDALGTRVARPVQAPDLGRVRSPQIAIRAGHGHSHQRGARRELLPAPLRAAVAAGSRRVDQEMPSLGVRIACASVCLAFSHKGHPDPRPEGHHGQAGRAPARPLPPLAESSHDGIVLERHRNLEGLLEGAAHVHIGPRFEGVGVANAAGPRVQRAGGPDPDRCQPRITGVSEALPDETGDLI